MNETCFSADSSHSMHGMVGCPLLVL